MTLACDWTDVWSITSRIEEVVVAIDERIEPNGRADDQAKVGTVTEKDGDGAVSLLISHREGLIWLTIVEAG